MDDQIAPHPAHEVLRLEAQLLGHIAELQRLLEGEKQRLERATTTAASRARPWWSWAARRQWHVNKDENAAATESVKVLAGEYADAVRLHRALRNYVIGLGLVDGPLAEAAAGWERPIGPPAGVATFTDEAAFLMANPHRAVRPEWPDLLAGTVLGTAWRRDGDDNPFLLDRGGTWQVGHILATSEIYATRRGPHAPPGVWLLGRGFSAEKACALLLDLESRMGQPNSLSLVATEVRAAAKSVDDARDP